MTVSLISSKLCFLLSLIILNVLSQEVVINQLSSQDYANDGSIKFIVRPNTSDQISGVSLFGWIKIDSSENPGDIFDLCQEACPTNDPNNNGVLLFSLQCVQWINPTLRFSVVQSRLETKVSSMPLSSAEINSWLFIYLGHSFTNSRQSYYKHSFSHQQRLIIQDKSFDSIQSSTNFYQLVTGMNQLSSRTYFIGQIERLTVHFGDRAYKENNFSLLHELHPETLAQMTCSTFFFECAFIGIYFNQCESTIDQPIKNFKSVIIKNNEHHYFCFGQKKIFVKKSIQCLTEENLKDLEGQEAIIVESQPSNECLE